MASDLIFEIGAEELPASFLVPAAEQLATLFQQQAAAARLAVGSVQTHATPRRIVLLASGVADRAQDIEERAEGPSVSAAFGPDGAPTKAAEGFARKFGLTVEQLDRSGPRLLATRKQAGLPAMQLLPQLLAGLIPELARNRKAMRWGNEEAAFPRPVRWICAVFGGEILPVKFADVKAAGVSYGHRFLAPGAIVIRTCDEYLPRLREAKVLVERVERRARVMEEIDRVAKEAGGRRVADDDLVETITGLVEWPSGVLGTFAADALDMPREVLISEMRGHQKYASLETAEGQLMPAFVAVANTPVKDVAVSRRGYERVLRARLADARYFFNEDRTRPLGDRTADLRRVTFQERLGSIHDKVERIAGLSKHLAEAVGFRDLSAVERVVFLCKADLTTGMVGEFPDLQGVMGREYARHDGQPGPVALGIFEHYLPRGAADALPSGDLGAFVGIADRLDTIAGIFAIGRSPTGANDPFGVRRACLGVIRVVLAKGYRLKLSAIVTASLDAHYARFASLPPPKQAKDDKKKETLLDAADARTQIIEFFRGRLKSLWSEEHPADVVEAVLAAGFDDLTDCNARLIALSEIKGRPDFIPLATAFGRASNIIEKQARDLQSGPINPSLFQEEQEVRLHAASIAAADEVAMALRSGDYRAALRALAAIRPAVDGFFDKVMVMVEGNPPLRENRLRLVQSVQRLFAPIADFARIQTK